MSFFSINARIESLRRQAVHWDQGVAYAPEFRASLLESDYPSRKAMLALYLGENRIEPSSRLCEILNTSILSGQGERWQTFGEHPSDLTFDLIAARAHLLERGHNLGPKKELESRIEANNGRAYSLPALELEKWSGVVSVESSSTSQLIVDHASAFFLSEEIESLSEFLDRHHISSAAAPLPVSMGLEFLALGMIDEAAIALVAIVSWLQQLGVREAIVVSPQAKFMLTEVLRVLQIPHNFAVVDLLEVSNSIEVDRPSFLYAGSFWARFLGQAKEINRLVPNTTEERLRTSEEYLPTYRADKRVNDVTIWQKPLVPEFMVHGVDRELLHQVFNDAYEDIRSTPHEQVVVFEPHSYHELCRRVPAERTVYFWRYLR